MTEFFVAVWNVLLELAPWLLVGAGVAGILHVLLPPNFLQRQFSGRLGVLKAVVLGVPLPLCSCGVIPVGLSLKKSGGSDGATVAFLISTPQTGVDSIFVSASMLGWPFALFKVLSAAVTGGVGGWLADAGHKANGADKTHFTQQQVRIDNRLAAFYEHCVEMLQSIWQWLAAGILVSAAIEAFVPETAFSGTQAYGGLAAMLIALLISLPLYVCATASVPIAAALVASGLPTGAALVFLMAGPATNVATLGAVYRVLGKKVLAVYLTTVIVGSILCGWLFEHVIDANMPHVYHEHANSVWWRIVSAIVLLALLGKFCWHDLLWAIRKHRPSSPTPGNGAPSVELTVKGMTCENCVAKLTAKLESDTNIDSARVSLETGQVDIFGDVGEARARDLVRSAGYHPE